MRGNEGLVSLGCQVSLEHLQCIWGVIND